MEEDVGHVIFFRSERSREILTGLTRRIEAVHSHMTLIIVFFFFFPSSDASEEVHCSLL